MLAVLQVNIELIVSEKCTIKLNLHVFHKSSPVESKQSFVYIIFLHRYMYGSQKPKIFSKFVAMTNITK